MKFGSLFTGIGGFDLGFEQAGMECAWQAEIDRYALEVLERHWPSQPFAGAPAGPQKLIKKYKDVKDVGRTAQPIDLLCGGFPCQDLSVAGKRAGLAGERSGLWREFARIIGELQPRWVVIENVPGLLSSNKGRDMGILTGTLAELGYGWAYRVLDSQHFGVAQRRRRVFIVANLGNWTGAAKVLLESTSGFGDPAPSREKGQVSPPLAASGVGAGRTGNERNELDFAIPVSPPLKVGAGRTGNERTALVSVTTDPTRGSESPTNLVPHAFLVRGDGGDFMEDLSPTMMSIHKTGAKQSGAHGLAIAFHENQGGNLTAGGDVARALKAGASKSYQGVSVFNKTQITSKENRSKLNEEHTPTLDANGQMMAIKQEWGVRRLTPLECERLQGFPDGWTQRGTEKEISDTQRYKMLGNAVTVPVLEWIGKRIMQVENGEL